MKLIKKLLLLIIVIYFGVRLGLQYFEETECVFLDSRPLILWNLKSYCLMQYKGEEHAVPFSWAEEIIQKYFKQPQNGLSPLPEYGS